jgi:hypothetical protein
MKKTVLLLTAIIAVTNTFAQLQLHHEWSFGLANQTHQEAYCLTFDKAGNVYIAGYTAGTTLDCDPDSDIANIVNPTDGYIGLISKYDADGNFIRSYNLSGPGSSEIFSFVIDNDYNIIVAGDYNGDFDIDPGPDTVTLVDEGFDGIFIAKFDSAGNHIFSHHLKGSGYSDSDRCLAVDQENNIYWTSTYGEAVDLDPGEDSVLIASNYGGSFIVKYDPEGNYMFHTYHENFSTNQRQAITLDQEGNIYQVGTYFGIVDFDPGPGTYLMESTGYDEPFLAKYNQAGELIFVKSLRCNDFGSAEALAIDPEGNIIFGGYFSGNIDLDASSDNDYYSAPIDISHIYIVKYAPDGQYIDGFTLGGIDYSIVRSIAIDQEGHIIVTGNYSSSMDFDPGTNTSLLPFYGSIDAYLAVYNNNFNFIDALELSGSQVEYAHSVGSDETGAIYFSGFYSSTTDCDPGPDDVLLEPQGSWDIFLTKYRLDSVVTVATNDMIEDSPIQLFPNPAINYLTITNYESEAIQSICIMDLSGRVLQHFPGLYDKSYQIDVAGLAAGVYILDVVVGQKRYKEKLVKID